MAPISQDDKKDPETLAIIGAAMGLWNPLNAAFS